MANPDTPNGFYPLVGIGGSQTGKTREYPVAWTTAIGQGSLVVLVSGQVQRYSAASQAIIGVAAHFVSSTGAGRTCHVYNDPDQLFVGQTDGNNQTTLAGFVGNNFAVTGIPLLNGTTGQSKQEIDSSANGAANTTNTLQCVDVYGRIDQEIDTANTRLIVKIVPQNHLLAAAAPGDAAA